ncbi:MAG TPA: DUF4375 domain-containing protein [Kofleriaceae bacterium]|nr:DUF4375 domain-containing protein [Kofleriaceae bacterium]
MLAVEALEREVNNGGYNLFFLNTPEHLPVVIQALKAIRCPRCADITAQAIALHGTSPDIGDNLEDLDECDDAYYANNEDVAIRLFDFIKQHRAAFRLPGP